ncbi:hypothetical protein TNCV_1731031 [Trichonephila clavipes]|nr:hypothetical protein TNCV_1731031 [Trichonephila clavipes]
MDTRRYPRAENRVWSDQEDHEERGSKDRASSTCGLNSDSFNDTSRRYVCVSLGNLSGICAKHVKPRTIPVSFGRLDTSLVTKSSL